MDSSDPVAVAAYLPEFLPTTMSSNRVAHLYPTNLEVPDIGARPLIVPTNASIFMGRRALSR